MLPFVEFFIVFLVAQILRFTSLPTGPTSVEVGKNLTLHVTYEYTGSRGSEVAWLKGTKILVRKIEDGSVIKFENRSDVKGQASLILASTTLMDNGTYTVRLSANDVGQSIDADVIVIIEGTSTICVNLIVSAVAWLLCNRILLTVFECSFATSVRRDFPTAIQNTRTFLYYVQE